MQLTAMEVHLFTKDIVKILLSMPCIDENKANEGDTLLGMAQKRGLIAIIQLLTPS